MYGIIYKITNLINGKLYIGQTTRTLKKRRSEHIRYSKTNKQLISLAIKKYGEESFNWEEVCEAYSREDLNEKEIYYISYFNTCILIKDSHGYNMTLGGEGLSGRKLSDEHKLKISSTHKGKVVSEEIRRKISDNVDNCGKNNPMYGKSQSVLSIEKNSTNQPNRKTVIQLSINGDFLAEYKSARDAERITGCRNPDIISCCRGKEVKTVGGFIWLYKEDCNEDNILRRVEIVKNKKQAKPIVQLTKDGVFISEYDSFAEASKSISGDASSIAKCCKKKLKTHRGYVFMYKEEYYEFNNT